MKTPIDCSIFFFLSIELFLHVRLISNWFLFVCVLVNEMIEFAVADSFWVANVYKNDSQLMVNGVNVQLLDDDLNFQLIP